MTGKEDYLKNIRELCKEYDSMSFDELEEYADKLISELAKLEAKSIETTQKIIYVQAVLVMRCLDEG